MERVACLPPKSRSLPSPRGPAVRSRFNAASCPIERLAALLRRHTRLTVSLAGSDWDEVDRARDSLDAAGLAGRVSVHHASAFALAQPRARRSAS